MKYLNKFLILYVFIISFVSCTTTKQENGKSVKNYKFKHTFYEEGYASFYGYNFAGRPTASGKIYDPGLLTAASKTIPLNTRVLVKDVQTGRYVVVTVNDRGPYVKGRVIDLSVAAAKKLGLMRKGIAKVEVYLLHNELKK